MGNPVEAFLHIGVQDIFGLEADEVENRFPRIVCCASGTKAIGVWLKPGFPFGF
jgi:hypothetical protein